MKIHKVYARERVLENGVKRRNESEQDIAYLFKKNKRVLVSRLLLRDRHVDGNHGSIERTALRRVYYALQFAFAGVEENREFWYEVARKQQLRYAQFNFHTEQDERDAIYVNKLVVDFRLSACDAFDSLMKLQNLMEAKQGETAWPDKEHIRGKISDGSHKPKWALNDLAR